MRIPQVDPQTHAFLFADLRGYSKYAEEHGDRAAADLIGRYRELVRAAIATFNGAEIRTEGDSFYVVFSSVSQAVRAGLAIRDAAASSEGEPIRVGIGVHAGEAEDSAAGIISSAVNIAARVCAVAEPGEVLVTETVRSLTRTYLPIAFQPRGRRRLKGISEPINLFAVQADANLKPSRVRRARLMGGLTAILVVAVAAVGTAIALSGGRQTGGQPSPSVATAEPSASATATFPDSFEADLLDRLPSQMMDACDRADRSDVPIYEDVASGGDIGEFPLPVVTGLTCLVDLTRVVYWHATIQGNTEAYFFQEVGRRGVPQGTCGESTRAWQRWESSLGSGLLLCWSAEDPFLWWTYDDDPFLVTASRRDGDIHDLLDWWTRDGRLLQREGAR